MREKLALIVAGLGFLAASTWAQSPSTRPAGSALEADPILTRMLQPSQQGRVLLPQPQAGGPDRTSGEGAVAPGAPTVGVLREGTYIVDRVGRLTRSGDGSQWEFAFEADGRALRDPPVVILPNLKLLQMENAAAGNRDLRFRVTGMLTEYKGRNYVLLEKVVVAPASP